MTNCFVLYALNIWTLPILWLLKLFYDRIYYVRCSAFLKRRLAGAVMKSGAEQVCEFDYFPDGLMMTGQINAVRSGTRLGERNPALRRALKLYGGHEGFEAMIDQVFVRGWTKHSYLAPFVLRFLTETAPSFDRVTVWLTPPHHITDWPDLPASVRFVTLHQPLTAILSFVQRLVMLGVLLLFPLFNAVNLWRKGLRLGPLAGVKSSDILFVHRISDRRANKARYEYLFHAGVLRYQDCSHYLMVTSEEFAPDKAAEIESKGGIIVSNRQLRLPASMALKRLVIDYYVSFVGNIFPFVLSADVNRHTFVQLLELLHYVPIAAALLDTVKPRLIVLETETAPFANVCAVEARKRDIRSLSMIHGDAGQDKPSLSRSNMQFEYILTPGRRVDALEKNNPGIDHIVAVGNHEIEITNTNSQSAAADILPERVRQNRSRYKVISCFAVPRAFSFNGKAMYSENYYIDDAHGQALLNGYLQPLFDWVRGNDDICFVWKAKFDRSYYSNDPWVAALIEGMPEDRFIMHYNANVGAIIEASDVCISSGGSSVMACAVAKQKPVITLDPHHNGWAKRYHPLMAAQVGTDLVGKLERLLDEGLPASVYDDFLADWYADGVVDFKTSQRISELIERLLAGSDTEYLIAAK